MSKIFQEGENGCADWSQLTTPSAINSSDCIDRNEKVSSFGVPVGNMLTTVQLFFQTSCKYGYVHESVNDAPDAFWSLSAENDWVCEDSEYGSHVLTAQGVGIILNCIAFLHLSDT